MPPREVPMRIARGVKRGHDGKDIGELDLEVVICRIAVVFRLAAAAVIECDDAARPALVARQRLAKRLEISRRAGEARQADHRQSGSAADAIAARMQPQAVAGGDEGGGGFCCCVGNSHGTAR